jgi:hypothetical protein
MNALIDQWGARNVGIAFMALAALCLAAAVMVGWEALYRGMGILSLDQAQAAALGHDRRSMIAHGREAAAWLPRESAAGLLAIDLSDPAAAVELTRLEQRALPANRPIIAAIFAVHQLHHGSTSTQSLSAGDQALISDLIKIEKGQAPGPLTLPDGDLPQATVSTFAAQRRFRAAWAGADRTIIRSTAGELRLLMPDHPDVQGLEFVLSALTPTVKDDALKNLAANLLKTAKGELIVLKMMKLAPERAEALHALLPKTSSGTVK